MQVAAQGFGFFGELGFVAPRADHLAQFVAVGGDEVGAGVFFVVVAFGVDQHGFVVLTGEINHIGYLKQAAFAVVGKDNGIIIRQQAAETALEPIQYVLAGFFFKINAQKLLIAREYAQFYGGGDGFVVL